MYVAICITSPATGKPFDPNERMSANPDRTDRDARDDNNGHDAPRPFTPVMLPNVPPPAGAYSPGARAGNLYFVSGQTPRNPETGQITGETIEAQVELTLRNVERVLQAGGASLTDVVSITVYLADENDWGVFDRIYRTVFRPPFPTRTVVGAALRGILVEVSAIAVTGRGG